MSLCYSSESSQNGHSDGCLEKFFLPEASFGLRVLSLPASVRVGVNHELVRAITCDWFQLESPNLN